MEKVTRVECSTMETLIQILHLEDDPVDAELVQANLVQAGLACRIKHVRTRGEFETALHETTPDIILVDFRVPMYDGMSALAFVQKICPDIPFIFVSGTMGEEAAIKALTRGATDYVLKQNLSRLASAVQRALQEARNRRERRHAQEALQYSNNLLGAIIEAVPVAIIGLDLEGNVHSVWNPAAERMIGWKAQDVIGRPLPTLPVDRQEEFRRCLEQNRSGVSLNNVEVCLQRRDGTSIDCSIYAAPLHDSQGLISGNIAVLVDITERKLAEAELKKHREHLEELVKMRTAELTAAKEQAETANAFKSDFLARMSHEIRTPLNVVIGLIMVVLKTELSAQQCDYLQKVQTASNNLLMLINDILDFSKIEAERVELANAPFDLDQLLGQLADLFSHRATQKGIDLIFAVSPRVPRQLSGDAGRLIQMLTNLVENAIKFTEKGEIVVAVELVNAAENPQGQVSLQFRVSDTGIGIAADSLPKLFEPFTQVEGYLTRRHEGTGLGLAICRRLVTLMGGRIWAESTPGKGSIFSFTLHLEARTQQNRHTTTELLSRTVTVPRMEAKSTAIHDLVAGRRVLVVEDNELNRIVALALLEEHDLNVENAMNGRSAADMIAKAETGYYDAVLMDIQMPVMDGFEATRKIREFEKKRAATTGRPATRVPIIALTAHAIKGEKEKCLATGMDDYLPKPIDVKQLARVLLKWVRKQDQPSENPHK